MDGIASKVGKRGAVVVPARLRRRFGLNEGSFVMAEEREEGVLIRPAAVMPIEVYSLRGARNFYSTTLSTNATTAERARRSGAWALIRTRFHTASA
jgi:AbrB family looped-hinge helix DNA binding protein